MKVILSFAVLFAIYHHIDGFACFPSFCEPMKCQTELVCNATTEIFVEKGSTCRCCDACYLKLNEGDKCVPRFHGGGAFLAKCADKLECGKDGTCIKKVSS
ncbi:unnamed protein product [Psylliodes chrysocephalus]|uniref:Uncharacterized protein n=1 Tax=Psylliodes chrysocephalus TaxID=3402493 RepID=A0A9P0D1G1_9CUCU|nr:unnamed protein product [Psylliodes chrysocephala]